MAGKHGHSGAAAHEDGGSKQNGGCGLQPGELQQGRTQSWPAPHVVTPHEVTGVASDPFASGAPLASDGAIESLPASNRGGHARRVHCARPFVPHEHTLQPSPAGHCSPVPHCAPLGSVQCALDVSLRVASRLLSGPTVLAQASVAAAQPPNDHHTTTDRIGNEGTGSSREARGSNPGDDRRGDGSWGRATGFGLRASGRTATALVIRTSDSLCHVRSVRALPFLEPAP